MTTIIPVLAVSAVLLTAAQMPSGAVELKVSREALQHTLGKQLFSGTDGRYYLKGNASSACSVYAEAPQLTLAQDRIVVQV
jgi:hypothetical protein